MARSAQFIDSNGFLLVKGCPVSSPGIFDYGAMQVGETEQNNHGDLNRIVKVYRPAAAVMDPQFIETLKNVPMIDDHEFMIGDETVLDEAERGQIASPEQKGIHGVMTDTVYWDAPWLRADLKIFSRAMQAAMRAGKKDLSLGYISDFEYKPGVYEGQEYEYIQTHMRGNHVALVDQGRVPGARVLDGLVYDSMSFAVPSPSTNNPESETMDETLMQRLAALLPQIEAMCGGEAAVAADPAAVVVDPAAADPAIVDADPAVAAAPAADPAAAAAPAAATPDLIATLEAILAELRGAAPAADPTAGAEETESTETESTETDTQDSDHTVIVDSDDKNTADTVSGIIETESDPQLTVDDDTVQKASPGPEKGTHTDKPVGDAAFRSVMAMAADRDQLARKLSKHVGTFDHARMTPLEVAEYGCAKLGLKHKGNAARVALDGYLLAAGKAAPAVAASQRTGDSASAHTPEFAAYLAGK